MRDRLSLSVEWIRGRQSDCLDTLVSDDVGRALVRGNCCRHEGICVVREIFRGHGRASAHSFDLQACRDDICVEVKR